MSESLIPKIKVEGVSSRRATVYKALGVVTKITQKPVSNGYIAIEVHLRFVNPLSGKEDTFYARWNTRPEWFSEDYRVQVEATRDNKEKGLTGPLSDNDLVQYDINMSGLCKGLFKSAGVEHIDLSEESEVIGKVVGFKTKQRKDDPSRLDLSYFFKPKAQ